MATQLDAIFKKIEKNSKQIAIEAMRDVAREAYKLSANKAKECLKNYYSSYKPKRYKRTKQLIKAIKTVKPVEKTNGGNHLIKFAIIYDSSRLVGLYHSNSWYHQSGAEWIGRDDPYFDFDSQNHGVVEPSFILSNYLEGFHPWAKVDSWSTDEVMTQFFQQELPSRVGDMIYEAMQKAVFGFLNSNGGGK